VTGDKVRVQDAIVRLDVDKRVGETYVFLHRQQSIPEETIDRQSLQFLSGAASAGTEAGGVAVWAHIAGFVTGVVWVWVFRARRTTWS